MSTAHIIQVELDEPDGGTIVVRRHVWGWSEREDWLVLEVMDGQVPGSRLRLSFPAHRVLACEEIWRGEHREALAELGVEDAPRFGGGGA